MTGETGRGVSKAIKMKKKKQKKNRTEQNKKSDNMRAPRVIKEKTKKHSNGG